MPPTALPAPSGMLSVVPQAPSQMRPAVTARATAKGKGKSQTGK
jgi:hypothetical protein